jgi:hypothetical protein
MEQRLALQTQDSEHNRRVVEEVVKDLEGLCDDLRDLVEITRIAAELVETQGILFT